MYTKFQFSELKIKMKTVDHFKWKGCLKKFLFYSPNLIFLETWEET